MRKFVILLFFACFLLCFVKVKAEISESGEENIVFTPGKIQKNITWSKGFSLKETGLETLELENGQSQDVWIQTHAFPIGLSWRPPSSATFFVSFGGQIAEPQIY